MDRTFRLTVHGKKNLYEPCNALKSQINTLLNDKTHIFSVPPVLEGSLWESLNHTLGSHVALLCEASGVPVPSITWLKDGTPIGKRRRWWNWTSVCLSGLKAWLNKYVCCPESSLQWQWSIRGNRLELGPLTLSHAGTYTCVAKNSEGQTRKDYSLTVQGKEALGKKSDNPTHIKNVFHLMFNSYLCPTQYRLQFSTLNAPRKWARPLGRS